MPILTLPKTLVAGTAENVRDIESNFAAFAHATGQPTGGILNGFLDEQNFAISAKPTHLLGEWQTVQHAIGTASGLGANSYVLTGSTVNETGDVFSALPDLVGLADTASGLEVPNLTTKGRLVVATGCNSTAPGVNMNMSLHRITAVGQGGLVMSLSVLGDTASGVNMSPSASSVQLWYGPEFTIPISPTNHCWIIMLFLGASMQPASSVVIDARLEVRHVG